MTPLERAWAEYEAANARARASYGTTETPRIRDQSGRVRKTKQVR